MANNVPEISNVKVCQASGVSWRRPCRRAICHSLRPLARAASTYIWVLTIRVSSRKSRAVSAQPKQGGQAERGADRAVRQAARTVSSPARDEAGQRAEAEAYRGNQAGKRQRGPHCPQELAQDVAAKGVASEWEFSGGKGRKRRADRRVARKGNIVELERIPRRDERAENGNGQTERAQDRPDRQRNVSS